VTACFGPSLDNLQAYVRCPEDGAKKDRNIRWSEDGLKKDRNMLPQ